MKNRFWFWGAWAIVVAVSALAPERGNTQTVPPSCNGTTYDCQALQITPYAYRRVETCALKPWKESEAQIYADEVAAWSGVCDLTTERVGWYTSETHVGGCGVASSHPDHAYGMEIRNSVRYVFRYRTPNCTSPITERNVNVATREREVFCPGNWGFYTSDGIPRCRRQSIRVDPDKNLGKSRCNGCRDVAGNPINTSLANKFQEETDYQSPGVGGLVLKRYYNSAMNWGNNKTSYSVGNQWDSTSLGYGSYVKLAFHEEANQTRVIALDSIGAQWRHYYQRAIYLNVTPSFVSAMAYRHDGRVVPFNLDGSNYVAAGDINDKLIVLGDGRFELTDADDETVETYLPSGQLETIQHKSGLLHAVAYDACMRIATVTDQFGHSLQFNYQHTCSDPSKEYRITSVTLPGGGTIAYGYNTTNGTLTSVTYPDLTSRGYTYGWDNGRRLTGITDESGAAFASWTYNSIGRPISSQHAGGAGAISVSYSGGVGNWAPGTATITDSLGAATKHVFTVKRGLNLLTKIERPHPSGTGIMDEVWTHDANGNIATYSNFRDIRTNYVFDLTRNLETSRTEGLNNNGTTTPETRTITTQWHAIHRLPTLITQPGRTTAFAYDANGNMLTKTVTDTATSASRTWTWSYDAYGHMLTADGPRTDVADVTSYTYYTCATGFECGQLASVTNAAGHVTTYSTYNVHGQPLTIIDPNNVLTTLTYDSRQRLSSRSVGTESTGFAYWPTGLLKRVTAPDGTFIEYSYDAAHRLTQIVDDENNRVVYTLDAMGNRIQEQSLDPSSVVARTHYRTVDLLNRLKQEIGSANTPAVTTAFTYDNQGNLTNVAAPLGRSTTHAYDKLDRLSQTTGPASGLTAFAYNARDDLTSVTDPRNLVTSYSYNGFGDLMQLTSPDTGVTTHTYDSGGNPQTRTDARGQGATYGHDALNRIASAAHSDQTIGYSYDSGTNGIGRLTSVADNSGSTSWTYTPQGRVATRSQITSGLTRYVGYGYDSAGRLSTLSYPSGVVISYGYTAGKLTSVTSGSETILSGVLYDPFGPLRGWTWGNASQAVRSYDPDGNLDLLDSGGLKTYAQDDAFRITGIIDTVDSNKSWNYGYDLLDRLSSANRTGLTQGWSYDANGNRLSQTGTAASTYTMSGTSNRLNSVSGSLSRSYSYDAAGNATADGAATFGYDGAGRMTSATAGGVTAGYAHNALGQRVRKTVNGVTTVFSYDESGQLLGEYEASGALIREYVWLGDIPVAVITGGPGTPPYVFWYIHTDHLNTPRSIENPTTGELVWRWDSAPFGETVPNEDPDGDLNLFTLPLRFPGQYADLETGLNYNYFRDFDPAIGRYVQSDPIGLQGGINTYGYAEQSPVLFFDAFGLESSATQVLCRQAGIPTEAERCVDQAACFEKAKNGMIACQRFGSVIRKMTCIRCWEAYESTCPGKSPAKGCDKQACQSPRQENRVVRL